jgi:hypothetical protein
MRKSEGRAPVFAGFTLAFALQLRKNHGKTTVRVAIHKHRIRTLKFYVLFVCKCVLYYCNRVATQLQLTNISYHIITNSN